MVLSPFDFTDFEFQKILQIDIQLPIFKLVGADIKKKTLLLPSFCNHHHIVKERTF